MLDVVLDVADIAANNTEKKYVLMELVFYEEGPNNKQKKQINYMVYWKMVTVSKTNKAGKGDRALAGSCNLFFLLFT